MKHYVADVRDLSNGAGKAVTIGDLDLAVFLIENVVYIIENLCPHHHIPVLADGSLDGVVLTCPMHGWRFDVSTGTCVHASGRLKTYPVEISNGAVYVEIAEDRSEAW